MITCRPHRMGKGATESVPYHSLAFVLDGVFRVHQSGGDVVADPLTAILFAEGDEYSISHPLNAGDRCIELRYSDETIDEARRTIRMRHRRFDFRRMTQFLPIANATRRKVYLVSRNLELDYVDDLQLEEIALSLLREVGNKEYLAYLGEIRHRPQRDVRRAKKIVADAKELLLSDIGRNWQLKDIACAANVSPFYLTRLVCRYTGEPLHRYLVRQRLSAAFVQLLDGAENLTDLALDLGFSSHSHFSACFKKEYGGTPSEVRSYA
jgi:AraC-like DNA-binding protein